MRTCGDVKKLPSGVIKACSGVVEAMTHEPWCSYVRAAEAEIGQNYAGNHAAQQKRRVLIEAVELNLINRKENSYERLVRQFMLPVDRRSFYREKIRFCCRLADLCGFLPKQ